MADRDRMPIDDEDDGPDADFGVFMAAIMTAWHEDKVTDPIELMKRAEEALAALPPVSPPAGMTPIEHALALVERVDKHPDQGSGGADVQRIMDALKLWPLCAEGYMFVCRIIEGREQGILLMQPFYMLALEALWSRLGSGGPLDRDGKLKDVPEAAMYLRCLCGLGEALASQGRFSEAMAQYSEALRFDPTDSEKVRPRLAIAELMTGQVERARDTLDLADDTLLRAWVNAFVTLAIKRDGPDARKALAEARGRNAHLWSFVVGSKVMPGFLSGEADFDEAQYAMLALEPTFIGARGLREWVQHVARAGHAQQRRQMSGTGQKRRKRR
jgi:tetratricopeptide (TPR) repeat protein